jgi:hypothetical protein
MGAYTLLGEVGGGWALEFPSFLGPQMELAYQLVPISQGPKNSGIPGHPSKTLCTGLYKSQVHK